MELSVQTRTITGKKLKSLRHEGLVPAIIYGKHLAAPIMVTLNKNEFIKFYEKEGSATAVTLKGDQINELVLIQDIQLDPVQDYVMHIDFHAVKADEKVIGHIPVVLVGVAPVEKLGEGRVQLIKDHIEVEAFPQDLPKEFSIDISGLEKMHDTIHVQDIHVSDKVTILEEPELTIVTVVELAEEEVEGAPTTDAAGNPLEASAESTPAEQTQESDEDQE